MGGMVGFDSAVLELFFIFALNRTSESVKLNGLIKGCWYSLTRNLFRLAFVIELGKCSTVGGDSRG